MLSEQVRAIGGVWGESELGFRQSLGKFPGLQLMRFQLQSSASNKVCDHSFHDRSSATSGIVTVISPGFGPGPLRSWFSNMSDLNM